MLNSSTRVESSGAFLMSSRESWIAAEVCLDFGLSISYYYGYYVPPIPFCAVDHNFGNWPSSSVGCTCPLSPTASVPLSSNCPKNPPRSSSTPLAGLLKARQANSARSHSGCYLPSKTRIRKKGPFFSQNFGNRLFGGQNERTFRGQKILNFQAWKKLNLKVWTCLPVFFFCQVGGLLVV